METRKVALRLRIHIVLIEDLSLIPIPHTISYNSRKSEASSNLTGTRGQECSAYTHMHKTNKHFLNNNNFQNSSLQINN